MWPFFSELNFADELFSFIILLELFFHWSNLGFEQEPRNERGGSLTLVLCSETKRKRLLHTLQVFELLRLHGKKYQHESDPEQSQTTTMTYALFNCADPKVPFHPKVNTNQKNFMDVGL